MLGLGYPRGPLAMGDAVGAAAADRARGDTFFRDPRYRPAWLKRRARWVFPF
jgi:3-hydroxybutyryl-CoA dehydrogenase